jgi:lipoyl(octanoyl) transferase
MLFKNMEKYIEVFRSTQLVPYMDALNYMEDKVGKIASGDEMEKIWLLEHPSLYTSGTSAKAEDLLTDNLPVYNTGRGGEYTYHGPGQRVGYFMLDLKKHDSDIKKYVYNLEETIIKTLQSFGIKGERKPGRIGIWVCNGNIEEKIAAIGIRVRRWVSFHGIAINLNPDLNMFKGIVPCGIKEHGVTSFAKLGLDITMEQLDKELIKNFQTIFNREVLYVRQ